MQLVVIESPLKGQPSSRVPRFLHPLCERVLRERNRHYAFACMREEMAAGRAPYASHVFFDQPGLLEDSRLAQRSLGLKVGFKWGCKARVRTFYRDLGVSGGMVLGASQAKEFGQEQVTKRLLKFKPLPLWRAAVAAGLRWMLARAYGAK